MNTLVLHLQSATQYERVDDVASFVGEDDSGSFGVMAGHARMITCLSFGLARYRRIDGAWRFLALPGAVLYFRDNQLYVNTRRYVHGEDYRLVSTVLRQEMLAEEESLRSLTDSLERLREEMFRRLWDMQREMGAFR